MMLKKLHMDLYNPMFGGFLRVFPDETTVLDVLDGACFFWTAAQTQRELEVCLAEEIASLQAVIGIGEGNLHEP